MAVNRKKLQELLDSLLIKTTLIEHPEVFTVEAMLPHLTECRGIVTKNLFLKAKKKKTLWLVSAQHDKKINLTDLGKKLSVPGGFRFADESVLEEKLGVKQGCVTPFAVMADTNQDVKLVLDKDILNLQDGELVYGHPFENSATIGVTSLDFLKFLKHVGHDPTFVELSGD